MEWAAWKEHVELSQQLCNCRCQDSTVEMGGPGSKGATYKISKEIVRRFKEESGSVICKELKGVETGTPAKACPDCVKDAARILEEVVFGE